MHYTALMLCIRHNRVIHWMVSSSSNSHGNSFGTHKFCSYPVLPQHTRFPLLLFLWMSVMVTRVSLLSSGHPRQWTPSRSRSYKTSVTLGERGVRLGIFVFVVSQFDLLAVLCAIRLNARFNGL